MKKQKKLLIEMFYNEFKMLDKLNYIKKVMNSCTSLEQLDSTLKWGEKVLWNNCDMMNRKLDKYDTCFSISISFKMIGMTKEYTDDLIRNYNVLSKNL